MNEERRRTGAKSRENDSGVFEPLLLPSQGRVLSHVLLAVKEREKVDLRINFSLAPLDDEARNRKAGVVSVSFLDASENLIEPSHSLLRPSERFGHFAYMGVTDDEVAGEFRIQLQVPPRAVRLVVTVAPFSNPSLRLAQTAIASGPDL